MPFGGVTEKISGTPGIMFSCRQGPEIFSIQMCQFFINWLLVQDS